MILTFRDGESVELDGQFGTAKRKLAAMDDKVDENGEPTVAELKTADGKRIAIGPAGSSWTRLVQE